MENNRIEGESFELAGGMWEFGAQDGVDESSHQGPRHLVAANLSSQKTGITGQLQALMEIQRSPEVSSKGRVLGMGFVSSKGV